MSPGADGDRPGDDQPDDDRAVYDEDYYRSTYGAELDRRLPRLTREQYWARWLRRRVDRTRPVVDLGAGLGWLAQCVTGQGMTALTIDISEFSARRLRTEEALDVVVASATRLPLRAESTAAVVALDVLEHVDEPAVALGEIRRVLARDGYVVLSVPNVAGTGARTKRSDGTWFGDRDETHTSLLPPGTWVEHLTGAGFAVKRRGSDFLWDVPYPVAVPERAQRAVLLPLHRAVSRTKGSLPWTRGENLVLVGRAT
jgi:SAM-dependent methyltransferase